MAEARIETDHYRLREYYGDWEIGCPYGSEDDLGVEVTVLTGRRVAEDVMHFLEWRLVHPKTELDVVLPLTC